MFSGDLVAEDLMVVHRLDLASKTKPIYVVANDSHIRLTVPDGAFKVLDKTDGANPMIA